MSNQYPGSRVKSHHFAGFISIVTGLSFAFEGYSFDTPFLVLDQYTLPLVTGQDVVGYGLILLGVLCLWPNMWVRALGLIGSASVWTLFGCLVLWSTLLGPEAGTIGSYTGIVSVGMAGTCLLGATNLRRDFYRPKRFWRSQKNSTA